MPTISAALLNMTRLAGYRRTTLLVMLFLLLSLSLLVACSDVSTPSDTVGEGHKGTSDGPGDADSGEAAVESSLEELAKQEGTLTWYSTPPIEAATALAEAFTADTGIKVEIFRQTGGPMTETFLADDARNDTKADVITHSEPSTMIRLGQQGLIAKYVSTEHDKFPPAAIESMLGYGYPEALLTLVIAYNEDLVTGEELEFLRNNFYDALIDPRFKGQISFADPNVNGSSFNHVYLIALSKGGWESSEAQEWFRALAANEPILFASNGPVSDVLSGGEVKVAMILENFAASQIKHGAPIGMLYPPQTFATLSVTGVVAKAPHPNAARYFLDWFMSKKGQETYNKVYDVSVGHIDAEDQRDYLLEKEWYDPDHELYFVPDLLKQDEDREPFLEFFNETFGL